MALLGSLELFINLPHSGYAALNNLCSIRLCWGTSSNYVEVPVLTIGQLAKNMTTCSKVLPTSSLTKAPQESDFALHTTLRHLLRSSGLSIGSTWCWMYPAAEVRVYPETRHIQWRRVQGSVIIKRLPWLQLLLKSKMRVSPILNQDAKHMLGLECPT